MRYDDGYRKAKTIIKFYLNTYIIPFGLLLIAGLMLYKHVPPDVKAHVFNDWPDGRIIFSSNRDGNRELYTVNPDGSDLTRITHTPGKDEYDPVWSSDGDFIAFTCECEGNTDIEVMNPDGANRGRLTTHRAIDREPCFSPDGEYVAFTSYRNGQAEIYVVSVGGKNLRNVSNSSCDDTSPSWDPGENLIYFMRTRTNKKAGTVTSRVHAVSPDGGKVQEIFAMHPYFGNVPTWSRKGNVAAFSGGVYPRQRDGVIYMMKRGKRAFRAVTNFGPDIFCCRPVWSPDGRRIAFTRKLLGDDGCVDIYVVDANGGNMINLTNGMGKNDYADWYVGNSHGD